MSGRKLVAGVFLYIFSVMGNVELGSHILNPVIGWWSVLCSVPFGIAIGLAIAEMTKD